MTKKKKIDPRVQRMMESFNRKPTAADEADFYRRNAGGPMVMTSLTRGNGMLGTVPFAHVMAYHSYQLAEENERKLAERRRTFHDAHVDAYWVQWSHDFMAQTKHPHTEHIRAWFYHLYPQHKTADMLNPFKLDP